VLVYFLAASGLGWPDLTESTVDTKDPSGNK
jgi:hypothetical protein